MDDELHGSGSRRFDWILVSDRMFTHVRSPCTSASLLILLPGDGHVSRAITSLQQINKHIHILGGTSKHTAVDGEQREVMVVCFTPREALPATAARCVSRCQHLA